MSPADFSVVFSGPPTGNGPTGNGLDRMLARLAAPLDAAAPDAAPPDEAAALAAIRRAGLFDAAWYLRTYPDVAEADPLRHYHREGWCQGSRPNPYFDPAFYLDSNPDVRRADIDPLLHYLHYGEREGRRPVLHFDPVWYRETYGVGAGENCLGHFLARRFRGAVSPIPEFDVPWYLRAYPDVAASGMDPVEHYMIQGYKEARNPSPGFDARFYRQRYLRDAAEANPTNPPNPLLHYLRHRGMPGIHPCMPAQETSIAREVRRFTRPGPEFEPVRVLPEAAPRRALVLAYYLPQFHVCKFNETFWGPGFSEWTNIARGLPRFAGHYQPRVPRDLGFYTLDDPAVMRRQIALAKGAGLGGFVFYFYWFNGDRPLARPLEAFLADARLDFPFCLMWANENWTRRWDGAEQAVLLEQRYRPADEAALIAAFARHFADPRYIRIAGRPLLMVYRAAAIPDAAGAVARWRRRFREAHGEDPILVMAQSFGDTDPRPYGLDGAVEFPPHKLSDELPASREAGAILDPEFSGRVHDYQALVARSLAEQPPAYPLIRTALPGWDNDARRQGSGVVIHGATPAGYQEWLERLIEAAAARPFLGERLVCINAWNEWAEGAYLEPDQYFGAAFLNATGRAVAGLAPPAAVARLLLIGHDAFPAGAQHLLLALGRQLRRAHGVEIAFLLLGGGALREAYAEVATVTVAEDDAALARLLPELRRDGGFRAAIVNSVAAAAVVPRLTALGIATTLMVHELPGLIEARGLTEAARLAADAARQVVFAAPVIRDRFAALTGMDAARGTIVAQGCYKPARFSAETRRRLRREFGLAAGAMLAVGIGYGDLRKGFDLFLQVARAVRRRRRPSCLLWIGDIDPELRRHLGAEMAAAAANGACRFLGYREDASDFLSAADTLLLPSREDPYPAVALEALSAGLPIVAFAGSGAIPELLQYHEAGAVVPMGDAEAMARAALALAAVPRPRAGQERLAAVPAEAHRFDRYAEALLALARPDLAAVSVVVPSYNNARHLGVRLASIFAQTYPVLEVILLDDASSDDSVAVARRVAADWQRELTIVAQPRNSGSPFRQWAAAARLARGEFVWIAEADDAAAPAFLERLLGAMAPAPDARFGFTDSRAIDEAGETIWPSYQAYYADTAGLGALAADDMFTAEGFARRFLAERNLILNASAVLWRRDALLAALARAGEELARHRLAGDWLLYLEATTGGDGGSVAYVASPLNIHRRHAGSVTGRIDAASHLSEIRRMHAVIAARLPADKALGARQAAYLRSLSRQLRGGPGRAG